MVLPKGNDEIDSIDQFLSQLPLNVPHVVDAYSEKSRADYGVDCLGLGFNAGRLELIGITHLKLRLHRILRPRAPKNISRTDKENRL